MSKTVIASLLSVAGLAAAAQAQVTIEIRIVDDSDTANRPAGLPSYFLPGSGATAVGLTLQARVMTGSVSNFGISGLDSTASANLNTITHNDSVSNGWTGGIQRGAITGTGAEGAGSIFGGFNPFRQFIGSTTSSTNANNWNAFNGNAQASQNGFPGNASAASGTNVNASLPGTRTNNGFQNQDSNNRTQLTALFLSTATVYGDNGAGGPLPVGGYTPTEYPAGQFSPWANLYHFLFVPRPNSSDLPRTVTVNFTGRINYGRSFAFNDAAGNWLLTSSAGRTVDIGAPVSASFQVPTPGAAALLGLGGLAAFRRRRA